VCNAVQPGPQGELAVGGPQPGVGAHEHVLQSVLGILAAREHLPDIAEQALAVAIMDDAERFIVAGAEERNELLVRAQAKQRRPERSPFSGYCGRSVQCGGFH
jgi:hypothetical protein